MHRRGLLLSFLAALGWKRRPKVIYYPDRFPVCVLDWKTRTRHVIGYGDIDQSSEGVRRLREQLGIDEMTILSFYRERPDA